MNKNEFLNELANSLKHLPEQEINGIVDYYKEIIEDKIEAGICESGAVESVGSIEEIVNQALSEGIEMPKNEKTEKTKKSRQRIILIAGSPLWIPLLAAAFTILVAAYVCVWAGVISILATEASLVISLPAGILGSIFVMCMGDAVLGLLVFGICVMASGVVLISVLPCIKLAVLSVNLTKKSVLGIAKLIMGGE